MIANNTEDKDQNEHPQRSHPNGKVRNIDRRPKGIHPKRRRSICLSPEIDRLAENEKLRRGYPSVSALIEDAVAKDVAHKAESEEADLLHEVKQIGFRLHRIERESADRDTILVELIAGLVRTYFATAPQPSREEQRERIAPAKEQFERFLDAVGRKIESGQTTLQQLPDVNCGAEPAAETSCESSTHEKNLSPEVVDEGGHNGSV